MAQASEGQTVYNYCILRGFGSEIAARASARCLRREASGPRPGETVKERVIRMAKSVGVDLEKDL